MNIFSIQNKTKNYKPLFTLLVIVTGLIYSSCKKEDIISKSTMSQIISELYLSDEYIEQNPEYRGQTDSLRLYPGIIKKYGYTMDDYERSIKHYLEDKETYKELHIKAKEILQKREEELTIIQIGRDKYLENQNKLNSWWVLDSLKSLTDKQIAKDEFLFILKNINQYNYNLNNHLFKSTDTSYLDTTMYPNMWNRLKFIDTTKFQMFKDTTTKKINDIKELKDITELKNDNIKELKRDNINELKNNYTNNITKEAVKPKKNLDKIKKLDNN